MANGQKYVFQIGAYTPETMPMLRLAEYMVQLARLLGNEGSVHFDEVSEGSTKLAVHIDEPAVDPVSARVTNARSPEASAEVVASIRKLDELVAEDSTIADLYLAANDGSYREVAHFGGRLPTAPKTYGPFSQPTTIDAYLRWAGGKVPHAKLVPLEGQKVTADCTHEQAKLLGHHLYEWLRFQGEGKWFRDARGKWELRVFIITSFTAISNESLPDVVQRLRGIRGSGWDSMKDPLAFVRELRDDN
jgi:hypothetical protein